MKFHNPIKTAVTNCLNTIKRIITAPHVNVLLPIASTNFLMNTKPKIEAAMAIIPTMAMSHNIPIPLLFFIMLRTPPYREYL